MASFPFASPRIHGPRPKPTNISKLGFRIDPSTTSFFSPLLPNPSSSPLVIRTRARFRSSPQSLATISRTQHPSSAESLHENPNLLRSCFEGAALFLVGSLLFLGRFHCRPALAVANAPRSNFSAPLEEATSTQEAKDGKGEEDEVHEEVSNGAQEGKEAKEEEDEVEMYERMLESNPRDVEALKIVLYGKMKKGKTKEAVKYVERLIELEPDEIEWRLLQALSYELVGNLSKAKKLFKEILKERPLLIRALHGLALTMHKNNEGPAVFEMLNKALELARCEDRVTEERNIRILIAQMHVVKGDLDGASKRFDELINDNPRDFRPYLCKGIIYSLLDKEEEADEQFEIYRNLVPDEFPQRGFIDDTILAAKTESREQLEKESKSKFSYGK
ncbi:protein SLOW GREEN 1, chloroplastic isoform X1 [Ananas comosus]|uniref:Protein SLOW GREEN 1, chloroplastic isoform X1 n=1 Tax=Ananas comosus TaxID=4615 RepID=A0A6P5FLZ7_ANACO|nr:protein SLOW GREEN 1, chloroplastic isoform X1 [Ananas comosus]